MRYFIAFFKKSLVATPLLIFAGIFILLWKGLHLDPSKIPSPLLNKPAPRFILPTLNSQIKTSQQDLQGHVTLLNVWATWCYACALEHGFLLELAKQHQFVLLGLDYKDNSDAARTFLREYGNPYHLVALDVNGQAAINWGVYGTPETFIVDKHGIVRYKHIGPIDKDIWNNHLKPLVQQLEREA